jgi:hypothetical protein
MSQYSGVDHIYYNIAIKNDNKNTYIPATYKADSEQIILDNPSDYYMSLIRFSLSGENIPFFYFDQSPMAYSVTLSYLGDDYQVGLILPVSPDGNAVYNYQRMIDAINSAIVIATANLNVAHPGIAPFPPVLILDISSGLFSIYFPVEGYTGIGAVRLFFNTKLWTFFQSFYTTYVSDAVQPAGKDALLICEDVGNNYVVVNAPPAGSNGVFLSPVRLQAGEYIRMTQEYKTLYLWDRIEAIFFQAIGITARSEYQPAIDGKTNSTPILTDFLPPVTDGPDLRSIYQYNPSGSYRLIDMTSNAPLKSFGVQIYYRTTDGEIYPVFITPGSVVSLKLLFVRKGVPA